MAELKPAYLIHGEDEVKLDAWRARIRDRAAREGASLELIDAARDSGEEVAMALSSMTLAMGTRYVVVDALERWKDKDVTPVAEVLASPPPETVVVLLGTVRKEPGRKAWTVPAKLVKAVEKAGGEVTEEKPPKAALLPKWIAERGKQLGLAVDRDAAQSLVERIGNDQRRLMRELEKIACYAPEGGRVNVGRGRGADRVGHRGSGLRAGRRCRRRATARARLRLAEDLQDRGTDIMHILYALAAASAATCDGRGRCSRGGGTTRRRGGRRWGCVRRGWPSESSPRPASRRRAAGAPSSRSLAELDFAIRGGGKVDTRDGADADARGLSGC